MNKKNLIIPFTIFSAFFSGFSQNYFLDNFKPELNIKTGLMNGVIKEYVIDSKCQNTDNKLSQLDWQVKNIPYFQGALNCSFYKYVYAEINGKIAVPKKSGVMEDYDWLNSMACYSEYSGGMYPVTNYSWYNDDFTEVTNYSCHENTLESYYSFFASLGANVPIKEIAVFTPLISFEYEFLRFSGYNGYGTYKINNWDRFKYSGKVISYEQEYNSFRLGLKYLVNPIDFLRIEGNIFFSPKATTLYATDFHYTSGSAYLDYLKNTSVLNSDLSILFNISKYNRLGISGGIQYIPTSTNTNYTRSIDSEGNYITTMWGKTSAEGATDRFIWSLSLYLSNHL